MAKDEGVRDSRGGRNRATDYSDFASAFHRLVRTSLPPVHLSAAIYFFLLYMIRKPQNIVGSWRFLSDKERENIPP